MKEIDFDGQSKKKQCLRVLLEKSMSDHKRLFLKWLTFTRYFRTLQAYKSTGEMFFHLNFVVTGNLSLILFNKKEASLKEKTIAKMIAG